MKTLLFVTAFPPNTKSGGPLFTLNVLKDLSKKYIIDLIYFTYQNLPIDESVHVKSITSYDVNNFNCFQKFTVFPIFTRRFNKNILKYLVNIAPVYDIVYFDYTQVGIYSLYINHPYKVLRCHDIMVQKFSRKNKIFLNWIKLTEKKILGSVHKIFVPSDKDADIVKKEYNLNAYFTHEYIKVFDFYDFIETDKIFVFFGLWSRPDNSDGLIWFIKNVYPIIKPNLKIKYLVIGSGLSEKLKKKYILPYDNIEYSGFVDNPLDIIYKSRALIAPLFSGAGVKIKVIDAFTTGTPVIGTNIAFEGLPYIENLVYNANKPLEYAEIINNFPSISITNKKMKANIFKDTYKNRNIMNYL